jgi:hypothetical protein
LDLLRLGQAWKDKFYASFKTVGGKYDTVTGHLGLMGDKKKKKKKKTKLRAHSATLVSPRRRRRHIVLI